jgi:hypothetical protein
VQKLFQAVQPTATPTSIPQAISLAAAAFGANSTDEAPAVGQDILTNVLTLVLDGFTTSDISAVANGAVGGPFSLQSARHKLTNSEPIHQHGKQLKPARPLLQNILQHSLRKRTLRRPRGPTPRCDVHPTRIHLGPKTTDSHVPRHRHNRIRELPVQHWETPLPGELR